MSCALIARCDAGGLGAISREVFRHLAPERTLLLDLGARGRGMCAESAYDVDGPGQVVYPARFDGALPGRAIDWLCAPGITTLFSAETFYDDPNALRSSVLRSARANDIRTVLLAMPELAPWATTSPDNRPSMIRPTTICTPTSWRHDTLPGSTVLPVPIARDRFPYRHRTSVSHLYHPTGAAMLDRNGTDLLLRSLPHVTRACQLTIRSERPVRIPPRTKVDVEVVVEPERDYWRAVPEDADLLVLPRRYGGLCLPMQECASLGMPVVMLASDPYSTLDGLLKVPTTRSRPARMKGGDVPVFDADPRALAERIDWAIGNPEHVAAMSAAADRWAEAYAWHGGLGEQWCQMLDADCAAREVAA